MTVKFANSNLEKLYQGIPTKGKPKYNDNVVEKFRKTVLKLKYADSISEIKAQRGLNFELLKGDLKGFYSVRVDIQYRLIVTVDKDQRISISNFITIHDLTNHYR